MTLGCGGWGGNITSDNISPKHLLNIKRLAYEVRPAFKPELGARDSGLGGSGAARESRVPSPGSRLPQAPAKPQPAGISAQTLAARIDSFLESRGYRASADKEEHGRNMQLAPSAEAPAAFVCEDDVRAAMKAGRKVLIDDKTIVTPAARDLGEAEKLFVQAGWPR